MIMERSKIATTAAWEEWCGVSCEASVCDLKCRTRILTTITLIYISQRMFRSQSMKQFSWVFSLVQVAVKVVCPSCLSQVSIPKLPCHTLSYPNPLPCTLSTPMSGCHGNLRAHRISEASVGDPQSITHDIHLIYCSMLVNDDDTRFYSNLSVCS